MENWQVFLYFYFVQSKSEHPKFEECKKASERYFKASHKNTMACHADLKDDTHSLEEKFDKFGVTKNIANIFANKKWI